MHNSRALKLVRGRVLAGPMTQDQLFSISIPTSSNPTNTYADKAVVITVVDVAPIEVTRLIGNSSNHNDMTRLKCRVYVGGIGEPNSRSQMPAEASISFRQSSTKYKRLWQ